MAESGRVFRVRREHAANAAEVIERAFATRQVHSCELRITEDGEERDRELIVIADNGEEVALILRDASERRRAEQARETAEADLRRVLSAVSDCVWTIEVDEQGRWQPLFQSPGVEKLTGRPAEYFTGTNTWLGIVHEEDRARVEESARQLTRGEAERAEIEYRIVLPDGSGRWLRSTILAKPLPNGSVRLDGVDADITSHKALEEQFRQSQKMEAIARLAGGVAHDFNNLLAVITGHGYMLLDEIRDDSPAHANAEEILKAVDRAAALVKRLLAFGKRQAAKPEDLELNVLLLDMESMVRHVAEGGDIELALRLAPGLETVRADRGHVEQVIMNLIMNSRDAMPEGGLLVVETANEEIDPADKRARRIKPGSYVRLSVADTGCGMDAEVQARIFEPFFTTKHEGTGLGLSTVYGIVKQSGGDILVESTPGKGARFDVYLPRTAESRQKTEDPNQTAVPARRREPASEPA